MREVATSSNQSALNKLLGHFKWVWHGLSFESLLDRQANGGGIVLTRSIFITAWLYFFAIAVTSWPGIILQQLLDPSRTWFPDAAEWLNAISLFVKALHARLTWAGAIFAAVYVSLISRFQSQWLYLANLYNQIRAIEARTAAHQSRKLDEILAQWKAGFLEDAKDLHLLSKPIFLSAAKRWAEEPSVQCSYQAATVNGSEEFRRLKKRIDVAYVEAEARSRRPAGTSKWIILALVVAGLGVLFGLSFTIAWFEKHVVDVPRGSVEIQQRLQ